MKTLYKLNGEDKKHKLRTANSTYTQCGLRGTKTASCFYKIIRWPDSFRFQSRTGHSCGALCTNAKKEYETNNTDFSDFRTFLLFKYQNKRKQNRNCCERKKSKGIKKL